MLAVSTCQPRTTTSIPARATVPEAPRAPTLPSDAEPLATADRFRTTSKVAANCGPDYIRRQPNALADLDGDGQFERVSLVREGRELIVRIHSIPSLAVEHTWKMPGDYVEVGTTRQVPGRKGELWLSVGVASDAQGTKWEHAIHHFDGKTLRVAISDVAQGYFQLDFDGDGLPDPLVDTKSGAKVLRKGVWVSLPKGIVASTLHGMPMGFGQEQAVDLDGDGDRDLLVNAYNHLSIIEADSFREVWRRDEKVWNASIARWAGEAVLFANLEKVLHVFAANPSHTVLARFDDATYGKLVGELDPAGDNGTLALLSLRSQLVQRGKPQERIALDVALAGSFHDDLVSLGPVLIDGDAKPDLLGLRILDVGGIAFGGQDGGDYELVVLSPPGVGPGRRIWKKEVSGATHAMAGLVDLDHDGRYEIVVRDGGSYANCDISTGGGSDSTWRLLDGDGNVLWEDEQRFHSFSPGHRDVDMQAHGRPVDLFGDGRLALRMRAAGQEWYVVPASAELPEPMPPCIE